MPLDLLLVNAPSRSEVYQHLGPLSAIEPPVWAGLIATYALRRKLSVQILDAEAEGLTIEQTALSIINAAPRLAAFCVYGHQPSASTQCLPAASMIVRVMNANTEHLANYHITSIALGPHPSATARQTMEQEPFDFVCQGEGPRTVVGLLRALKGERQIKEVPGLWYRALCSGKADPIVGTAPAPNFENLDDALSEQAWQLLDLHRYRAHNWHLWTGDPKGGYASVQTSLNCVFACSFCMISAPFGDRKMRFWSPENVVNQITTLVRDHNISNIKIPDEMFCLNRQHVKLICYELIDRGLGDRLNMWAYARVDTVKDEEMLNLMRRAGFRWLGIGVESASQHVRDGVEKGKFGNEQIVEAVRRVQSQGIAVAANYIFGLPDDTMESMQATLDLACELNTEWANFYCAMAYPGSPLHKIAQERGWRLPEDPGGPGWIGYSQHAYETLPLPTETLTAQQVLDFRDQAFMHYFDREEYGKMIQQKFGTEAVGTGAVLDALQMLSFGKPRRKHRERKA